MYDFGSIVIERETEEHTRERRFNANAIENDHDECGVWRVACGVWRVACGVLVCGFHQPLQRYVSTSSASTTHQRTQPALGMLISLL